MKRLGGGFLRFLIGGRGPGPAGSADGTLIRLAAGFSSVPGIRVVSESDRFRCKGLTLPLFVVVDVIRKASLLDARLTDVSDESFCTVVAVALGFRCWTTGFESTEVPRTGSLPPVLESSI